MRRNATVVIGLGTKESAPGVVPAVCVMQKEKVLRVSYGAVFCEIVERMF